MCGATRAVIAASSGIVLLDLATGEVTASYTGSREAAVALAAGPASAERPTVVASTIDGAVWLWPNPSAAADAAITVRASAAPTHQSPSPPTGQPTVQAAAPPTGQATVPA